MCYVLKVIRKTSIQFYVGRHGTQIVVRTQSGQNILTITCKHCVSRQSVHINVINGIYA